MRIRRLGRGHEKPDSERHTFVMKFKGEGVRSLCQLLQAQACVTTVRDSLSRSVREEVPLIGSDPGQMTSASCAPLHCFVFSRAVNHHDTHVSGCLSSRSSSLGSVTGRLEVSHSFAETQSVVAFPAC